MTASLLFNMLVKDNEQNVRDGYPQDTSGNTCTQTIPDEPDSQINNPEKTVKMKIMRTIRDVKREKTGLFTADQNLEEIPLFTPDKSSLKVRF